MTLTPQNKIFIGKNISVYHRLTDTTFTRDEVKELLQNLKDLVQGEVEADLIEISHTNILLFSQLLKQAEKWHLRMSVDLSEIQNR